MMLDLIGSLPIADILLAAGAFGAAIYCLVLSRRLQKFSNLENGMGGAIAVLSAQIDDMTKMLEKAETSAKTSASQLDSLTHRSEAGAAKLEMLLASLHDLPDPATPTADEPPATFVRAAVPANLQAAE